MSAVEVVLLAPMMIFFILLLVAFGQQVAGRSAVDGAARDAARAGSLERSGAAANAAASRVARDQLADICTDVDVFRASGSDTSHAPGTIYSVSVRCEIRGLKLLGVPAGPSVTGTSASPIDPYRRSG
ncbi:MULTISPECIES: TadE/TadG family type IV pilus assembly protein [Streptomyces]|uniref:TadE/TadG family type IV pilus assembly protein n=1 Tax=Streptomyces TaxID=1883 RepID=UPI00215654CB|nr:MULTISPECIES: TadE/TadG family type IV pilus assembly protein [Streptomyces]